MEQVDPPKSMKFNTADALEGVPEEVQHSAVGPCIGVAAIALNMAMKYHDISTVQDGALYQQYKLEGRNMHTLGLVDVFYTAMQIEAHLMAANKRVAKLIVQQALEHEENPEDENQEGGEPDSAGAPSDTP